MSKTRIITGGLILLVSVLILAACTPGETPVPTVDTNMIFTAAAQTVQAQLTETAAAAPTATGTATPPPQATVALEVPTLAPIGSGTNTSGLLTATPLFTLAALPGASTATPALPASGDKAEWVDQSPADGTEMGTSTKFDIKWTVKNTGTTTWNKNYTIRQYAGDKLSEKNVYNFREETKPGSSTTVIADGVTPKSTGSYHTIWVLTNDQGQNFYTVDLTIQIGKPTATLDLRDLCKEESYFKEHENRCNDFCDQKGNEYCWAPS